MQLPWLYIWRTAGDDKVRSSHAALNGTIRNFSDSPDPGEKRLRWSRADRIGNRHDKFDIIVVAVGAIDSVYYFVESFLRD